MGSENDDVRLAGSWRELFGAKHLTASLVLAGGVAMYAMNSFVTVALLPSAAAELGGEQYYSWVVTSFLVASVLASMLVARALVSWGAALAYLIAFMVFAAGLVAAVLAPTMELLLVARVVQGLGGGLLAGLGYAVIRDALPERLWTRATGLVSAMWGVGTLVGPAIGGLFAQLDFWRGAYGLLAIVAIVLGVMSLRGLPKRAGTTEEFGRLPAASLALLLFTALAFSIAAVVPIGWPLGLWLSIGALALGGFILVERNAQSPVLPSFTYRRGNSLKWIYLALAMLAAAGMVEIFLPKFGQELAGMTPLVAGLFAGTMSLGWSGGQLFSASVDAVRTRRRLMVLGPAIAGAGLLIYALTQRNDAAPWLAWIWVGALVLTGVGIGLAFPHIGTAAMGASTDPIEGAKAAAGVGTVELIANALASAIVGVLVVTGGPGAAGAAAMGAGLVALCGIGFVSILLALRPRGDRSLRLPS